ncbi:MAG: hypothetical protein V3T70_03240 [Phycisphaerae bacterium]
MTLTELLQSYQSVQSVNAPRMDEEIAVGCKLFARRCGVEESDLARRIKAFAVEYAVTPALARLLIAKYEMRLQQVVVEQSILRTTDHSIDSLFAAIKVTWAFTHKYAPAFDLSDFIAILEAVHRGAAANPQATPAKSNGRLVN